MSVLPVDEPDLTDLPPVLRLVPAHSHTWRLRAVEYDDFGSVSLFECDRCPDVRYV